MRGFDAEHHVVFYVYRQYPASRRFTYCIGRSITLSIKSKWVKFRNKCCVVIFFWLDVLGTFSVYGLPHSVFRLFFRLENTLIGSFCDYVYYYCTNLKMTFLIILLFIFSVHKSFYYSIISYLYSSSGWWFRYS